MKKINKLVLVAGVAALAVTTLFAKSSSKQGTEMVHFSVHINMTNNGVEPTASGTVQATEAMQGNSDHETLNVTAKGLTPNTPYSLFVTTTATGTSTNLDDFTTDKKGAAKLSFQNNGGSKKTTPLPPEIGPLSGLTEVDIVNSNTVVVLAASSGEVTQIQYMVKKDITSNNVPATINVSASTKSAKFNLTASGLTPSTDYILVLNGSPVQTNTATAKGGLKINSAPAPADILSLNSVALTDTSSSSNILSAPVP